MGGQRRGGAAAGARRTPTSERKQGSGQKSASGAHRSANGTPNSNTPKPRKTAPRKVDPNSTAGALATEISAIVEAATPSSGTPIYGELEREANALLADSTPTIQSAAVKARSRKQRETTSAIPDALDTSESEAISSPGSSDAHPSRKHRTLSSMSGAWNRGEIQSALTDAMPDAMPEVAETSVAPTPTPLSGQDSIATRPVAAVSTSLRPRVASQSYSRRYWANVSGAIGGHHHPLPEADLIIPTAAIHTALAVVAAGAGAIFALQDKADLAITFLLLTGVLGVGAALAYAFTDAFYSARAAGSVLIASQLGALLWSFLLIGYRPSLLLLIPGLVILAARMVGPLTAVCMAAGSAVLYCASAWASLNGYFQPRLPLDSGTLVFIDTVVVLVGVAFLTWGLLGLHSSQARALAFARSKRYEAATLRDQLTAFLRDAEDDAEQIRSALATALNGEEVDQTPLRTMLSPLGDAAHGVAERVRAFQLEREERVRLEDAVQGIMAAVKRKGLGLPWAWPEPTGTVADELMAVLPSPPAPPVEDTLERELESLAQVSEFDAEELAERPRVPSWPRPESQTLVAMARMRKRPAYLRPVDTLEETDTPLPPSADEELAHEVWDNVEPQ